MEPVKFYRKGNWAGDEKGVNVARNVVHLVIKAPKGIPKGIRLPNLDNDVLSKKYCLTSSTGPDSKRDWFHRGLRLLGVTARGALRYLYKPSEKFVSYLLFSISERYSEKEFNFRITAPALE